MIGIKILLAISLSCALVSGWLFFTNDSPKPTRRDKIAAATLGISAILVLSILYVYGAN